MHFSKLGLSQPLLKAIQAQGYETPTPIQAQAIPAILQRKHVMAAAQTGTGKTAGFTLPILELLSQTKSTSTPSTQHVKKIRALILTPTRELAMQVADSVHTYGQFSSLRSTVVFGGVKINPQISRLRKGVDILVATPGRLLDLYQQRALDFNAIEILVLDEADRMLDMGFIQDIKRIIALLPRNSQNLLFSATFSDPIRALAKTFMSHPVEISVSQRNITVEKIDQVVYTVDKKQKGALLKHLIWEGRWEQVLIFTKTKHGADRLAKQLEMDGVETAIIHGNKSQGARTRALAEFKAGKVRALVATDIAARGLDITGLPHVVNYDLPHVPEDYVHRIGRTGRAGASGQAISLVSADEAKQLSQIEKIIRQKIKRETVPKFAPTHQVPETNDHNYRREESGRRYSKASRSERTEQRHGQSANRSERRDHRDYRDRRPAKRR